MHFSVVTLFPEIFQSPLSSTILKRARDRKLVSVDLVDLRRYARDRHRTTDDHPYGGGQGMVLKPEPLIEAIEECRRRLGTPKVILLSPRGRVFDHQAAVATLDHESVVLVCGRYEGIDERVVAHVDDLLSIGDYMLSGGEIAALAVIDTVARLVPGVLGNEQSAREDSFADGLLEYPQYTRPAEYRGMKVPDVLLSGDHEEIRRWRHRMSIEITARQRPDLLAKTPSEAPGPRATVYLVLLDGPVSGRPGGAAASSITDLDVRDIARTCRAYGVAGLYRVNLAGSVPQPAAGIIHPRQRGGTGDHTPGEARALVRPGADLDAAMEDVRRECGKAPRLVAVSARSGHGTRGMTFAKMRQMLSRDDVPCMILLGTGTDTGAGTETGLGLADAVVARSDLVLEPIAGKDARSHLSIPAASAVILDRMLDRKPDLIPDG